MIKSKIKKTVLVGFAGLFLCAMSGYAKHSSDFWVSIYNRTYKTQTFSTSIKQPVEFPRYQRLVTTLYQGSEQINLGFIGQYEQGGNVIHSKIFTIKSQELVKIHFDYIRNSVELFSYKEHEDAFCIYDDSGRALAHFFHGMYIANKDRLLISKSNMLQHPLKIKSTEQLKEDSDYYYVKQNNTIELEINYDQSQEYVFETNI